MSKAENDKYFESVYEKTYDYIYRFLVVKIKSRTIIDDIIQNVYLEFYQQLKKRGNEHFLSEKHYILKIARGKVSDFYKSDLQDEHEDIEDVTIVYEKALYDFENDTSFTFDEIMHILADTDNLAYRIFILHYKYDYTIKKTAKLLEIPEATAKTKIYRTLRKLKERYKEVQVK